MIGRSGTVDFVLTSQHVSRTHAKLLTGPEGFELQDLGSTYGTFVNGQRVQRHALAHGDKIIFGKGDEFHFFVDSAEPKQDIDTTRIVQKSLTDLGRVLPSEASDLEKILKGAGETVILKGPEATKAKIGAAAAGFAKKAAAGGLLVVLLIGHGTDRKSTRLNSSHRT